MNREQATGEQGVFNAELHWALRHRAGLEPATLPETSGALYRSIPALRHCTLIIFFDRTIKSKRRQEGYLAPMSREQDSNLRWPLSNSRLRHLYSTVLFKDLSEARHLCECRGSFRVLSLLSFLRRWSHLLWPVAHRRSCRSSQR